MPADGNGSKDFVDAAPDADGRQSASGIDPVNPTGQVGDAGLAAAVRASDEAACARFVRRFHGRMLATAKG